jgi:hypothetical protein
MSHILVRPAFPGDTNISSRDGLIMNELARLAGEVG